jgi:hypothetical protein
VSAQDEEQYDPLDTLLDVLTKQAELQDREHKGLRATVILCHKFLHAGNVELAQEVLCYATMMLLHKMPDAAWSEDLQKRVAIANTDLGTVECEGHA